MVVRGGVIGWTRAGEPFARIGYEIRTGATEGEFVPTLVGADTPMPTIPIVTTPLPWGGLRWWFRCPVLRDNSFYRSAKLYLPEGGNSFGCRGCFDLIYASCQASERPSRLLRARDRLLRKLGW